MCLILVGKQQNFKDGWVQKAWAANPDGAGVVIPGKEPDVFKGIMKYSELVKVLDSIPQHIEIAIHFRMATHGAKVAKFTHPFKCGKDQYLMHNGILQGLGVYGDKGYSDSAHLAKILCKLSERDKSSLLETLHGKFCVIGRKFGLYGAFEKHNDCYHSNGLLIPYVAPVGYKQYTYTTQHYGKQGTASPVDTAMQPTKETAATAPNKALVKAYATQAEKDADKILEQAYQDDYNYGWNGMY